MFKTYSSSSSLVITSYWFATSRLRVPASVRRVYWVLMQVYDMILYHTCMPRPLITRSWPVACGSPSSRNSRTSWNRGRPPEYGPGMGSRRGPCRQQSTVDTGWMLYRGTSSIMKEHDNACIVSQKNYLQKPWDKMNLMTHTKNSLIQYTMKWTKN